MRKRFITTGLTIIVIMLVSLWFKSTPQPVFGVPIASTPTPDPARPPLPLGKPSLQLPYIVPTNSSLQVWCAPGCGNHNDSPSSIKAYYAWDYGRVNPNGVGDRSFMVVAAAGGKIKTITRNMNLIGMAEPSCPTDADPNTPGIQGRIAYIDHGSGWFTYYIHLSEMNVPDNTDVTPGTIIGTAGCTGANSVHLHFALRWRDSTTGIEWSYPVDFAEQPPASSIDLAFVIDTSASMGDDIAAVKLAATDIVNRIKSKVPDSRIAIVDFRDFPSRTGYTSDYPYRDAQPFTFDANAAKSAINNLMLGAGGDEPESRNCALMHIMNSDRCAGQGANTSIGPWRPIQSKFIIILTDAPALSPEPFTSFTNQDAINAAKWGGFVLNEGDEGPAASSNVRSSTTEPAIPGIAVYPVIIGGDSTALAEAQALAANTGGKVFTAATSTDVADAILEAIEAILKPHQIYLPLISKNPPPISSGLYGRVTQNSASAAGVPLSLRFYNGSSWSTLATTTTAADGTYSFTGVPSLGSGQGYYVRYQNTAGTVGRLWLWNTRVLTSYTAGSNIAIGNFDIADITLVSPAGGSTVALPYTFQWTRRAATPSDSYELDLYDYYDGDPYAYTGPLGYVGSFTINGLPTGFSPWVPYVWTIWAYSPDGGAGLAYWSNYVTFSNTGFRVATDSLQNRKRNVEDLPVGRPSPRGAQR